MRYEDIALCCTYALKLINQGGVYCSLICFRLELPYWPQIIV